MQQTRRARAALWPSLGLVGSLWLVPACSGWPGAACLAANDVSGQLRVELNGLQSADHGPLWLADSALPGTAAAPASGLQLQSELHASGHGLTAIGTLQEERLEHDRWRGSGWVNELYGATDWQGWQFSAGKRIVAWDVGYGFRPNDVVEQEPRRTLLPTTDIGRPMVMAEHFNAQTAWTLVWVNPTQHRGQRGAEEPALAGRVYRREGSMDLFADARYGAHTHASLGASVAWVATESMEWHASVRALQDADTLAMSPVGAGPLLHSNPWGDAHTGRTAQALVGGTWTNADQLSLLAEAWWDGTALSDTQWRAWNARNGQLAGLIGSPAPAAAVGGNLAWQANAFNASSNLRRTNLYGRASWTWDHWQPAWDLLFTPADRGWLSTLSLTWQGDRYRVDAGWRVAGGPAAAVIAQTPTRRTAYLAGTWSF